MPEVKEVYTYGDIVHVVFTDNHTAVFEPYTHGYGYQVEGLRRFHLKQGTTIVCTFNGRLYRSGPRDDEDQLVKLASGYTQQQAASYWEAARKYLNKEYFEKSEKKREQRLWYPWMLVCTEGGQYFHQLMEGKAHQ